MRDLHLHGISSLSLETLSLFRNPALTSILGEAVLDAPSLLLTGTYSLHASAGSGLFSYLLPDLTSEGEQSFSINITNARIRGDLRVEMVEGCSEEAGEVGAVVTKIKFPFSYRDLQFEFTNIPTVLGAAVDVLGSWIIDYERETLVSLIRLLEEQEQEQVQEQEQE